MSSRLSSFWQRLVQRGQENEDTFLADEATISAGEGAIAGEPPRDVDTESEPPPGDTPRHG